jgi:hypothetical protein
LSASKPILHQSSQTAPLTQYNHYGRSESVCLPATPSLDQPFNLELPIQVEEHTNNDGNESGDTYDYFDISYLKRQRGTSFVNNIMSSTTAGTALPHDNDDDYSSAFFIQEKDPLAEWPHCVKHQLDEASCTNQKKQKNY